MRSDDREYLFNVRDDISETKNLITQFPEKAQSMHADLADWAQQQSPPGIWALKSDGMSRQAAKYFDWYVDGKRGQ